MQGGYGNAVIIDHGGQFATLYGHASKLLVTIGQKVSAGQVVALVGARPAMATGPHLHFEVRILGVPVNPVQLHVATPRRAQVWSGRISAAPGRELVVPVLGFGERDEHQLREADLGE